MNLTMARLARLLGLLSIALALVACSVLQGVPDDPVGSVVDGWPIGEKAACSAVPCDDMIEAATTALSRRDGGTPEISDVTIYDREQRPPMRTTNPKIAVFRLADGRLKAIAVYETFTGPLQTIDFGP